MPAYVLVHGGNMSAETWNRFTIGEAVQTSDGRMGGRIWDPIVAALSDSGAQVFNPTLTDEHRADLTDHIDEVCSIMAAGDVHDVVLVGHSYGGMVITGAAARHPELVTGLVYVDAALPDPGQSLFDIIREGGVDPLSIDGLEAAPPYVERLDFDRTALTSIRKSYLLCTKSEFAFVTQVAEAKIVAGEAGGNWRLTRLPTWHVPMADMPQCVSRMLLTPEV
jgi:pimeloyl-ACP methyl ester carboxylesterase